MVLVSLSTIALPVAWNQPAPIPVLAPNSLTNLDRVDGGWFADKSSRRWSAPVRRRWRTARWASSPHDTGSERTETPGRRELLRPATVLAAISGFAFAASSTRRSRAEVVPGGAYTAKPSNSLEDPVAKRIREEIGGQKTMRSMGQSWAPQQLMQNKRGLQIFYPPWMEGRWGVRSKYLGALTPLGQRFIDPSTPGARKGTIVLVADIGFDPPAEYEQRFYKSELEGGVVADRAFNVPSALKTFWPEAEIGKVDYEPEKNTTRLSLDYTTPPGKQKKVEGIGGKDVSGGPSRVKRAIEIYVNNRESGYQNPDAFLCSELYRQSAIETARSYDFQTNLALQRVSDDEVLAKYTIGALLNPRDNLYFESDNKAVVVYAYSLRYRRLPAL